jgi:hypothetical protein
LERDEEEKKRGDLAGKKRSSRLNRENFRVRTLIVNAYFRPCSTKNIKIIL